MRASNGAKMSFGVPVHDARKSEGLPGERKRFSIAFSLDQSVMEDVSRLIGNKEYSLSECSRVIACFNPWNLVAHSSINLYV